MKVLPLAIIALAIAGCSTWGGKTPAQIAAADDVKCQEYGFKPGSDSYGNCRLQLDQGRAQRVAMENAALLARNR